MDLLSTGVLRLGGNGNAPLPRCPVTPLLQLGEMTREFQLGPGCANEARVFLSLWRMYTLSGVRDGWGNLRILEVWASAL
jgi:hypothetical protein